MLEFRLIQLKMVFRTVTSVVEQSIPVLHSNNKYKEDTFIFLWNMPAGLTTFETSVSQINFYYPQVSPVRTRVAFLRTNSNNLVSQLCLV